MRALGIDPGSRVTGWGVVDRIGDEFRAVEWGTVRLRTTAPIASRLATLQAACVDLFPRWGPTVVVLERAFVGRNMQSALRLGETRGVILAAAAGAGLAICEYTPAEVKLAAVGHGRADKETVARGVASRLALDRRPAQDASDALAIALCHLQHAPLRAAMARAVAEPAR